jgi:hypothetical protein
LAGSLIRKNPFTKKLCYDKKCFQCISNVDKPEKIKISCRVNCVGYSIKCKLCEQTSKQNKTNKQTEYIGETGQNAITRGKKHKIDFESKSLKTRESSALFKHMTNCHREEVEKGLKNVENYYCMLVTKRYKDPLTRQGDEGTNMQMAKGIIINSKSQWHQPAISRTMVWRGGAEILQNSEIQSARTF